VERDAPTESGDDKRESGYARGLAPNPSPLPEMQPVGGPDDECGPSARDENSKEVKQSASRIGKSNLPLDGAASRSQVSRGFARPPTVLDAPRDPFLPPEPGAMRRHATNPRTRSSGGVSIPIASLNMQKKTLFVVLLVTAPLVYLVAGFLWGVHTGDIGR
jgi:hypothetical protein